MFFKKYREKKETKRLQFEYYRQVASCIAIDQQAEYLEIRDNHGKLIRKQPTGIRSKIIINANALCDVLLGGSYGVY